MKPYRSLACLFATALAATGLQAEPRGFNVHDLVALERVADPQLAPEGSTVVYTLRQTDLEADRGVTSLWRLDWRRHAAPRRLSPEGEGWSAPRFDEEGRCTRPAPAPGRTRSGAWTWTAARPVQVTDYPLPVASYGISRDGSRLALAFEVFPDCDSLACTAGRLEERKQEKASGQLYESLFVRHWDTWKDGRRMQLFVAAIGEDGRAQGEPVRVSQGLNGDVPTRPFGGDGDFAFSAGGQNIYFVLRDADAAIEPTSTNLDIWQAPVDGSAPPLNLTAANEGSDFAPVVSPDGWTLAYLSMARAGFEADRHRIMLRDLASGQVRELAADWDRSASSLAFSADGTTLYVTANERGQNPLFGIDIESGQVTRLTGQAMSPGWRSARPASSTACMTCPRRPTCTCSPAGDGEGAAPRRLTRHNQERLAGVRFGQAQQFHFPGWNNETVHAYVVKPWNFEEGQRYPVAFIIHGGPQGSMGNSWHYRWNPQAYAGAGFAVVFIDFHGSTGYGQAFTDSISGDWGGKPLEDLQKGWAAALEKYDFLDADRACALGASYGGYMINWIAGNWFDADGNSPWKCLVNHDGVFDTRSMGYVTEELWFRWDTAANTGTTRNSTKSTTGEPRRRLAGADAGGAGRRISASRLPRACHLHRPAAPGHSLLLSPDENHWVLKPQPGAVHDTVIGWLQRWTQPIEFRTRECRHAWQR